jgi:beta-N-acetylglucosaminidase
VAKITSNPIKKTHKRRTQDEMSKALGVLDQHRDTLHRNVDDEHVDVLYDAVRELMETRAILAKLMQGLNYLTLEAQTGIKAM